MPTTRKLTTHVLDTAHGVPAAGVRIVLFRDEAPIKATLTNADGRTDGPLLEGDDFVPGTYRLEFAVGDYFEGRGHRDAKRFLDVVPVVFHVDNPSRPYHIPLLVSPWSYSTYRGS